KKEFGIDPEKVPKETLKCRQSPQASGNQSWSARPLGPLTTPAESCWSGPRASHCQSLEKAMAKPVGYGKSGPHLVPVRNMGRRFKTIHRQSTAPAGEKPHLGTPIKQGAVGDFQAQLFG